MIATVPRCGRTTPRLGVLLMLVQALAGAASCAEAEPRPSTADRESALIGGTVTPRCAWPSVGWLPGACTATLIHPRLIVYAAHCGTTFSTVAFDQAPAGRIVALSGCQAHPDGAPGTGLDVAFCLLAEEVSDIPIVPVLAGCETALIAPGQLLTLVGFGAAGDPSSIGTKREWTAPLTGAARELIVGGDGHSICGGDSGAPAFAQLPPSPDGSSDGAWRLVGVASSTNASACDGQREARVSPVPPLLAWLEDASGLDVTPCFDGAQQWQATPGCGGFPITPGAGESAESVCAVGPIGAASSRCGSPFDPAIGDTEPPHLRIMSPLTTAANGADGGAMSASSTVTVEISVSADDGAGWGIQVVRLQLQDASGGPPLLWEDQTAPYTFVVPGIATGTWQVRATAIDHAGLVASETVELDLSPAQADSPSAGCVVGGTMTASSLLATVAPNLLLALLVAAGRRRRLLATQRRPRAFAL